MKFVQIGPRTINLAYVIQVVRDARGIGKHDLHMARGLVIHLTPQELADLEAAMAGLTHRRRGQVHDKAVRVKP